MFPTLSSLFEHVFGVAIPLPIPTFGFFVALAFILAYIVFLNEFKRKEREGVISAFEQRVLTGGGATIWEYLEYGFLGFLLGFKLVGAIIYDEAFVHSPIGFFFSLSGSYFFGAICASLFCYLIFWQKNQERLKVPVIQTIVVHPNQLMPKMILWAALWGFLGAKIFHYLEHIELYSSYSMISLLQSSGLTFLGGLLFGAASYLYIGYKRGLKIIDLADIGSPGMLVAYGVGRIGCQLSGDGDWGIVNDHPLPVKWLPEWMWSFKFPHNVLNAGEYMEGCSGNFCFALSDGVFPTSFYETVIVLACFSVLWLMRRRMKYSGTAFCFYLLIMGIERFFIEKIRPTFKYDVFGFDLSEAQCISLLFIVLSCVISVEILLRRSVASSDYLKRLTANGRRRDAYH